MDALGSPWALLLDVASLVACVYVLRGLWRDIRADIEGRPR